MPHNTFKAMMSGAIHTIFDPAGPDLKKHNGSTTQLSESGRDSPSLLFENSLQRTPSVISLRSSQVRWNLWRVTNSDFAHWHCVELMSHSKPTHHILKLLRQLSPSKLTQGNGYAFFRLGVEPRWEDPALRNGGSFVHYYRAEEVGPHFATETIDQVWMRFLRTICLTVMPESLRNEICGLVVYLLVGDQNNNGASAAGLRSLGPRPRNLRADKQANVYKIEMWIRRTSSAEKVEQILLESMRLRFFYTPGKALQISRNG